MPAVLAGMPAFSKVKGDLQARPEGVLVDPRDSTLGHGGLPFATVESPNSTDGISHLRGKCVHHLREDLLNKQAPLSDKERHAPREISQVLQCVSETLNRRAGTYLPLADSETGPERRCVANSIGMVLPPDQATALDVTASIKIAAEWRRVFSALSNLDYMEVWLDLPEEARIEYCEDSSSESPACINFTFSTTQIRIRSSKIQAKHDGVTLLWERIEPDNVHTSMVDIVLKDGPRRCTLRLRHSALRTWHEKVLYSTMWHRSLEKLQSLMR